MGAIKNGDKGIEVTLLQGILRALSHEIDVDGIFGAQTESAVKEFQASHELGDDGIVGKKTAASLAAAIWDEQEDTMVFNEEDGFSYADADSDGDGKDDSTYGPTRPA